jgi:hypothetical protein
LPILSNFPRTFKNPRTFKTPHPQPRTFKNPYPRTFQTLSKKIQKQPSPPIVSIFPNLFSKRCSGFFYTIYIAFSGNFHGNHYDDSWTRTDPRRTRPPPPDFCKDPTSDPPKNCQKIAKKLIH